MESFSHLSIKKPACLRKPVYILNFSVIFWAKSHKSVSDLVIGAENLNDLVSDDRLDICAAV